MASSSTGQELAEDKDEEDAEKSKQDEKTKPHVDQESKKPQEEEEEDEEEEAPQAEEDKSKQDETAKSQVDQASITPQAASCNTRPLTEKASEKVEEAVRMMGITRLSSSDISYQIWDFGGQSVFYALHHVFLTRFGIYIVCFNLQDFLHETLREKALDRIKFWCHSIHLHTKDAPVILVGTHLDDLSEGKLEEINKYVKNVVEKTTVRVIKRPGYDYHVVDNATGTGIPELRTVIDIAVRKEKYIKKPIPVVWRQILDEVISTEKPYMGLVDVVQKETHTSKQEHT